MVPSVIQALGQGVVVRYAPVLHGSEADAQEARLLALLDEDERLRHGRFRFAEDRAAYRTAHALTRRLLARFTGLAPEALCFSVGEHGRPELEHPELGGRLRFNLSHTRGLVACALCWERDVGVDVERVGRSVDILRVAGSVFSDSERAQLAPLEGLAQRQRFFELWTLKEAYIKAIGKGFAVPLTQVSFEPGADTPTSVQFGKGVADSASAWRFMTQVPSEGYLLSVAVRDMPPGGFDLRQFCP